MPILNVRRKLIKMKKKKKKRKKMLMVHMVMIMIVIMDPSSLGSTESINKIRSSYSCIYSYILKNVLRIILYLTNFQRNK